MDESGGEIGPARVSCSPAATRRTTTTGILQKGGGRSTRNLVVENSIDHASVYLYLARFLANRGWRRSSTDDDSHGTTHTRRAWLKEWSRKVESYRASSNPMDIAYKFRKNENPDDASNDNEDEQRTALLFLAFRTEVVQEILKRLSRQLHSIFCDATIEQASTIFIACDSRPKHHLVEKQVVFLPIHALSPNTHYSLPSVQYLFSAKSPRERQDFCRSHHLKSIKHLPCIYDTDPLAVFYDFKAGDVLRVAETPDETYASFLYVLPSHTAAPAAPPASMSMSASSPMSASPASVTAPSIPFSALMASPETKGLEIVVDDQILFSHNTVAEKNGESSSITNPRNGEKSADQEEEEEEEEDEEEEDEDYIDEDTEDEEDEEEEDEEEEQIVDGEGDEDDEELLQQQHIMHPDASIGFGGMDFEDVDNDDVDDDDDDDVDDDDDDGEDGEDDDEDDKPPKKRPRRKYKSDLEDDDEEEDDYE